jgi:hypothetical protein
MGVLMCIRLLMYVSYRSILDVKYVKHRASNSHTNENHIRKFDLFDKQI